MQVTEPALTPSGRRRDNALNAVRKVAGGARGWAAVAIVVTVAVVLYAWEHVDQKTQIYASRPSDVIEALRIWFTEPTLRSYIPVTLMEAGLGLLIGVVSAIVIGGLLSSSRVLTAMFAPYLAVMNAIPKIALAPLFLVIFGIDTRSKIIFVAVAIFFIPFQGLLKAMSEVDPVIVENARMLGANWLARVRDVYLLAIVGSMTATLRVAAAFALLATIVAELVSSTSGIGFQIHAAQQNLQPNFLIAGIVLIGVIGFLFDRVFLMIERRLSRWQVS